MNTLPITIALLLLLAILGLSSFHQAIDRDLTVDTLTDHSDSARTLESKFQSAFYQLKLQESLRSLTPRADPLTKGAPSAPRVKQRRPLPQFPSRLNLDPLLEAGDSARKTLYAQTLHNLLNTFHPDHTLNGQVVEALLAKLPGTHPTLAEHLATIDLSDLHPHWVTLLRTQLLDLLTFGEPQINIAHAPRPLLIAIFDAPPIADAIIARREALIESYNTETTATAAAASQNEKSTLLKTYVEQLLSSRPDILDTYTPELTYQLYYRPSELTVTTPENRLPLRKHHSFDL